MRFDQKMDILEETRVSDGMGGATVTQSVIGTIDVYTTPVTAEMMLKQYGLVSTKSLKVFTKDTIPNEFVQLQLGDVKYKILQLSDYGKVKILLVEVINNG